MKNANIFAVVFAIALIALVLNSGASIRQYSFRGYPSCASNMKQIGLGLVQYAQDYDEAYPNVAHVDRAGVSAKDTWRTDIWPYIKSQGVYQCPSRTVTTAGPDGLPRGYVANDTGACDPLAGQQGLGAFSPAGAKPLTDTDYPSPSSLIAICETSRNLYPDFDADDAQRFAPQYHRLWAGHDGKFNVLFADGHVKGLAPTQTGTTAQKHPAYSWYRNPSTPLSANGIANLTSTDQSHKDDR